MDLRAPVVQRQTGHFAAELAPGAIEIGGRAVFIGQRDQRGRVVRQMPEQRFAFAYRRFGLAPRRHIVGKASRTNHLALRVKDGRLEGFKPYLVALLTNNLVNRLLLAESQ